MSPSVTEEFLAKQTFLVISPHADDEAFGCAGTMARVKHLGGKVYVMLMSVGDIVQYNGRPGPVRGEVREEEFVRAMELLKVDGYDVVYRDAQTHLRLDALPRRELIAKIERESAVSLERVRPTVVALPAISYNQDHAAVFHAGFTACRPHLPELKSFPSVVLAYENPTLFWNVEREKFHPNFYVDITDFLKVKLEALRCHASQARPSLHHCSLENLESLTRVRGREISVESAEAFMCFRFVL